MPHDLIRHWIILLLNHIGMPLNRNMALLQKVFYGQKPWLNNTATALLHPVALRARVTLPVDRLEYEWLEALLLLEKLLPVVLAPPELVMVQELAAAFQDVVGKRPNLLVDTKAARLGRQNQDQRRGKQLRLVRVEEVVRLLDEAAVVHHCVYFVWKTL